jgi:hypothetical protein
MLRVIIGNSMAAPYVFLFFTVWIAAKLARPMTWLTVLCVLSNPIAAWRKLGLFLSALQYLALCNDKKWKAPAADPASFFPDTKKDDVAIISGKKVESKTIIFVRHGESTWNDTFNKGDRSTVTFLLGFIPGLCYAVAVEYVFWLRGLASESWFYDSPLSDKGKRQAASVQTFLRQDPAYLTPKEAGLVKLLQGGDCEPSRDETSRKASCSSQLVSSNLRRAIATMAIGFQDRFDQRYDRDIMLILPCLQEISRNPDALSITPPYGEVVPAWTDPYDIQAIYETQVDTSKHTGNKPVDSNGLKRLQEFCRIVFQDVAKDCVIAAGHSLWFRSFFRTFLPTSSNHVSKTKKLVNGGVVGFTLQRIELADSAYEYMIDPTSIVVLHGGF